MIKNMNDIDITDLHRIFIGKAPTEFLVEVLIRAIITFLVLVLIVRWLGKRMSGQLTITELAIMILLGAIVAPAMESPDKGILMGVMILFLILFYQRTIAAWGVGNAKVENLTQGILCTLVMDGIIQLSQAKSTGISHAQIFAVLRGKKIYNLGQVDRLYLEACGLFSVYKSEKNRPGLSVLPPKDPEINKIHMHPTANLKACNNCGNTKHVQIENEACNICGETEWSQAVNS
jgi:uncharacterized membrane protein YcaP (DUF421 family)